MFSFNDESISRSSSLNYTFNVTTYLLFVNNYFGYPKTKVVLIILFLESSTKLTFDVPLTENYNLGDCVHIEAIIKFMWIEEYIPMSMIEFHNVEKYYGKFHALKNINLTIDSGETVVLIGPSGSGKSTLIRTINGLDPIQSGQLIVNGYDLSDKKTNINKIRREVGMVFQHFNLYNNKSVLENIMLAPRIVLKRPEDENRELAMQLLDKVSLASKADNMPAQLSGGQKQRIAIARSLAMKPKCLLFDEPTSALDPEMIDDVLDVMKDIAENSNMTMLVVTHEMSFARAVADRVIFMADGQILEDDSTAKFFGDHPSTKRAQEFMSKISGHIM